MWNQPDAFKKRNVLSIPDDCNMLSCHYVWSMPMKAVCSTPGDQTTCMLYTYLGLCVGQNRQRRFPGDGLVRSQNIIL